MSLRKPFIVLALLALVSGVAVYAVRRGLHAAERPLSARGHAGPVVRLVKNPAAAPPFEIKDLAGETVSPSALHGKVVLLNFWATWCPPCREEIPELVALQSKYRGRLQVIGISEDDEAPAKVLNFARQKGVNYPIVMATPELEKAYGGVPALPTTFVLDAQGRVVQRHTGLYPQDDYDRELDVLLNLPTDARVENFEDIGQVFLSNVDKATELPGVDFSGLTDAQKKLVLRRMNAEPCTCGCKLTVAECRLTDSECPVSLKLAAQIVGEVRSGASAPPAEKSAAPRGKSSPSGPPAKSASVQPAPARIAPVGAILAPR